MCETGRDVVDYFQIQGSLALEDMPDVLANKLLGFLFVARPCAPLASISPQTTTANGKTGIRFYGKTEDLKQLGNFLRVFLPTLQAAPDIIASNYPNREAWEI